MNTYFGDIHFHNGLGYGLGSLERSIDIAREHLDFFAFTGHSSWHDIPSMESGREDNWFRGFEKLREAWPTVLAQIEMADVPGKLCAFLGYEWHSSRYGDQCIIFPDGNHPLVYPESIQELTEFARRRRAILLPHHLAYPTGNRGVNWGVFDETLSPLVEIFSEHGNSESDRGPHPFVTHSMGGRITTNTAEAALMRGLRFGFTASSDNHRGFPGGYGEGLTAVQAAELSREGVFEALLARRTYAITGDRIRIDLKANGRPMGSSFAEHEMLDLAYSVEGLDALDVVEVVSKGRVVHRSYPASRDSSMLNSDSPIHLRVEWGWGPWTDLDLPRTCDWEFELRLGNGKLVGLSPCLQSGPFDEDRRHRISRSTPNSVRVISYTSRSGAFRQNPNQGLVLSVEPGADCELEIVVRRPSATSNRIPLKNLLHSSEWIPMGSFPAESILVHRPVSASEYQLSDAISIPVSRSRSYVYLRIREKNGQMAWTSPVFLNYDASD